MTKTRERRNEEKRYQFTSTLYTSSFTTILQKNYGCKEGDHPVSEDFYQREVSLPIYPDLMKEDQERVISEIKELLNLK